MSTTPFPKIRSLEWADIRSVLPNEAHHFTPWIAQNLDLLADAIGLDELEPEATEWSVDEFRLDVLATGRDGAGDEIVVVIENQYGRTDHDHLGKLVTYAARAEASGERMLAVWTVEKARPAHLAAVEFLNRISPPDIGWMIVAPRFVPAPDGEYFVHFDLLAEPNEFLRAAPPRVAKAVNQNKVAFMSGVADEARDELLAMGYHSVWSDPKGGMIRISLPSTLPAADWVELRLLSTSSSTRIVPFVSNSRATYDDCFEVLDGIRSRHGAEIEQAIDDNILWHESAGKGRSDWAHWKWGDGFEAVTTAATATALIRFSKALIDAVRQDTEEDFPDTAHLVTGLRADAETVLAYARLIEPGEWTTYGELSRAITGSTGSAMSIGNVARTRLDFPNPHRVLNRSGAVPDSWTTHDGSGGPEVCRELLEAEGVQFDERGRASTGHRIDGDELAKRAADQT